jgi:hypothetical protein
MIFGDLEGAKTIHPSNIFLRMLLCAGHNKKWSLMDSCFT